jgi:serpin B
MQDAVIKVDEKGSEAAAVTTAGMMGATAIPDPPKIIDFHCDHPFLYLITEASTGVVLFAGEYTGK